MTTEKTHTNVWRWIALVVVLLNIFINYYSNAEPFNGQTIGEVSRQHPTLFTPAGYAFSIWGVIYLSFILYAICQLLPSQRKNPVYDRLAIPLTLTSLLCIAWVISFTYELLGLSVVLITAMLITAILLFGRAKLAVFQQEIGFWVTIPFALYAGWLSVAIIANAATWLKDIGWQGGAWGETSWTIIMIAIAFLIALLISYRFRDLIFPLVVVWASIAIWVARQDENAAVALFALLAAVILFLWVAGFGLWLMRTRNMQTAS
jgi:hypothetical protein